MIEVCRNKKKCLVSAEQKAALANLKNPHSPQRICSEAVNGPQNALSNTQWHAKDWSAETTEQESIK